MYVWYFCQKITIKIKEFHVGKYISPMDPIKVTLIELWCFIFLRLPESTP